MTWFLYRRPDGAPEATEYELPLAIFPGYSLVRESADRPVLEGTTLNVDGDLVPDEAAALRQLRARRRALLQESDWTQLEDSGLTLEEKLAWQEYRQSLRDITDQVVAGVSVAWPEAPPL